MSATDAAVLFAALLECETVEAANDIALGQIIGNPVSRVDISHLIADEARAELGIRTGCYSLGAFAHILRTYPAATTPAA